jgi:hypothetical protein
VLPAASAAAWGLSEGSRPGPAPESSTTPPGGETKTPGGTNIYPLVQEAHDEYWA